MAAEIQLFGSYAISLPDKLFAGITALDLVTLMIFIISVSGTAAFFESRFTSMH